MQQRVVAQHLAGVVPGGSGHHERIDQHRSIEDGQCAARSARSNPAEDRVANPSVPSEASRCSISATNSAGVRVRALRVSSARKRHSRWVDAVGVGLGEQHPAVFHGSLGCGNGSDVKGETINLVGHRQWLSQASALGRSSNRRAPHEFHELVGVVARWPEYFLVPSFLARP